MPSFQAIVGMKQLATGRNPKTTKATSSPGQSFHLLLLEYFNKSALKRNYS